MPYAIFEKFYEIGVIPVLEIDAVHRLLKFFPAETMGGLKAIQAISDPFPQLGFIPTDGIRLENVAEYLQNKKIHAVGGSWMAKRAMIAAEQFTEITRMAKEASDIVKQVRRNNS